MKGKAQNQAQFKDNIMYVCHAFYANRVIHLQGVYATTVLLALPSSQPVPLILSEKWEPHHDLRTNMTLDS